MSAPANNIAIASQCVFYPVLETTKNTLAFPLATGVEACVAAGMPDMGQQPSFVNSLEVVNSRDVMAKFQNMTPAGTFSIPIYLRPSGTAGSVPMGDSLFLSLFGKRTISAGTSVVYSQQIIKPSLSIWYQRGHTVFFGSGGVIDALKIGFTNKGGCLLNFSGQFCQMGMAGTDALQSTAASAATSLTVYNGKLFTKGAVIWNVTKGDKSTNGYTVTDVNGNVLTLSSGISQDWAIDDVIAGYLPPANPVGSPLAMRDASFSILGASKSIKQMDFTYADKVKMLDDEITPNGYPQDYIEDQRNIEGSYRAYLRRTDIALFADGMASAGNKGAVNIQIGATAGKIATLNVPNAQFELPDITNAPPAVEFVVKYTALANSNVGENSATLSFT